MGYEQPEEPAVVPEDAVVDTGLYVLSEKSFTKHVSSGDHFISMKNILIKQILSNLMNFNIL